MDRTVRFGPGRARKLTVHDLERSRPRPALLLGLLALAAALRLWNASLASLKLDDFHSLYHARAADLGQFFETLQRDNHPPLAFLLVRAARAVFGEDPWGLRMPSLLAGLGGIALVWRLSRRLSCPAARIAATGLLAVSSLHIELSGDVRMYALLALCTAGLLDGLLDLLEDGRGVLRTALWTAAGLHTHYHFLYTLACLAAGALGLAWFASGYRPRRRALLLALALGGLCATPWYLLGFPAQLEHGLPPGGSSISIQRLLEGLVHLVLWNLSIGGPVLRAVFLVASALVLALALTGLGASWRAGARERKSALPLLLGLGAFAAPALTALLAWLVPRAGYEWRYLAGALAPFVLLVGSEACATGHAARLRRSGLSCVCACATLLAALNVVDPGGEDYRGAVSAVAARICPADAVVAVDAQPQLFPQALAWDYYWARAGRGLPVPRRLATRGYALVAPQELSNVPRVFCCLRSLPAECHLLRQLRQVFPREEVQPFGRSVYLHVFSRAGAAAD